MGREFQMGTISTSRKNVFQMKTSACWDGTLKNQPNKMGTTPQHIYTQHCSLHSRPCKRQSIPDSSTFSSNEISQHNLKLQTYHAEPALLTVSSYKTDYTCLCEDVNTESVCPHKYCIHVLSSLENMPMGNELR